MATATTDNPVTFFTRYPELELVIDPLDHERNHRGQVIKTLPRRAIKFGNKGNVNEYVTSDPEEIEILRNHPHFEVMERGFWELGNAPDEPQPTMGKQIEAIAQAAAERDVETLKEVIQVEKDTHNREAVFAAARGALKGLEEKGSKSPSRTSENS